MHVQHKGTDWTGCPEKTGYGASFGKCVFKRCTIHKMQMEVAGCDLREGEAMNEEAFCVEGGDV